MHERFTDRSRKVMQLASQEAQRLNHEYVGTEHILLGLIKEGSGVAATILKNLGVDLRKVRNETERICVAGPDAVTSNRLGKMPQTPRAKKAIQFAIEEARNLNHNYVGTEHILLGLLREEEGIAAQILKNLGLKSQDVREEILYLLGINSKDPPKSLSKVDGQVIECPIKYSPELVEAIVKLVNNSAGTEPWRLHPAPAEASTDVEVVDIDTLCHKFWLRDDFEVEITLPRGITHDELVRLLQFVELLPSQDGK